jgi:hypothetical protein
MSNSLVIQRSPKGKSTLHTITEDGTLIGKRTSKNREYDFAVVILQNKEQDLAQYRESVASYQRQLIQFEAIANAPTADEALAIQQVGYMTVEDYKAKWPGIYQSFVKSWNEGWYASNGNGEIYKKTIADYEAKIVAVESGSLDAKYAAGSVWSWHSRLDLAMKVADKIKCYPVRGIAKFVA